MQFDAIFCQDSPNAIRIFPIVKDQLEETKAALDSRTQAWLALNQFKAESGSLCLVPDEQGELACVLVGLADQQDYWAFGAAATKLPAGDYALDSAYQQSFDESFWLYLAWGLGAYRFTRYKKQDKPQPRLRLSQDVDQHRLQTLCESIYWVRDQINTPAEDLRPEQYAAIIKDTFKSLSASVKVIEGKAIVKDFPLVNAVGRAGEQAPRLIDIQWGNKSHQPLTLVGKGVCFDSGGLNLKTGAFMNGMKKDMGGSAIVLGIAQAIIRLKLPINLRVITPLVENAVSGNSMRPDDIFTSRLGKTVEIGNTDAEGRLVLADALALACEAKPDYLIDFATLTGAARVAMGPDVPAYFTNDDSLAQALEVNAAVPLETIARLPLYQPYRKFLDSKIADINNMSSSRYGGAITAALFLKEFVSEGTAWVHVDVNADNTRDLAGRPEGGEAHGLLTVLRWAEQTFSSVDNSA